MVFRGCLQSVSELFPVEVPASSSFGGGFILKVVMLLIIDGAERLIEPQPCGETKPGNT